MTHPLCQMAADGVISPTYLGEPCSKCSDARTGVYAIWMVDDAKRRRYIGQALDVGARIGKHRSALRAGNHHTRKLQNAYNKYGEAVFVWALVEAVVDHTQLTVAEQAQMDAAGREYLFNTAPAAGSCRGVKRSEEVCAAISARTKAQFSAPTSRASVSAGHAAYMADPKNRAAISARKKAYWANPANKGAHRTLSETYWADPANREASSARTAAQMAARTPEQWAAALAKSAATREATMAASGVAPKTPEQKKQAARALQVRRRSEKRAAAGLPPVEHKTPSAPRTAEQKQQAKRESNARSKAKKRAATGKTPRTPEQVKQAQREATARYEARYPERVKQSRREAKARYVAKCKATREAKKLAHAKS